MVGDDPYADATIIAGTAVSSGRATGFARCVEIETPTENPDFAHAEELEEIRSGEIVVVSDFLPMMCDFVTNADGLIISTEERLTARGATYARQLGIPAVIDCPEIGPMTETRDLITVDGEQKRIRHYG